MKLAREDGNVAHRIQAYEPGWLRIQDTLYERSLLLTSESVLTELAAERLADLTLTDLQPAIDWKPELILLGTGVEHQLPERALMRALISSGIGVEAMDTAAACRTFNLLIGEDRRVVAALLLR